MTTIPDAAIEAAAENLYRRTFGDMRGWNYADPPENWKQQARAAIEAAMPAIREHIAQQIQAVVAGAFISTNWNEGHAQAIRDAARIVREGIES